MSESRKNNRNNENSNNANNNNNNYKGEIIMTNGTIRTMEVFVGTVKAAMETVYAEGYRVQIQEVKKNNGLVLNGITIMETDRNIAPTIYLDSYFEDYRSGRTMESIVRALRDTYEAHKVETDFSVDMIADFANVKSRICFKLINAGKNQELLSHAPFIQYMDLAIIFFILVSEEDGGNATITIHDGLIQMWGNPDVNELFTIAKANTQRFFRGRVASMMEVMGGIISENPDAVDPEMLNSFFDLDIYEDNFMPMFVATNTKKLNGAGVILYDGLLAAFAEKMGGDVYILPSSIHETILLPANGDFDAEYLIDMVREVNATEVSPEEVLSDNVYLYHADEDRVEMM